MENVKDLGITFSNNLKFSKHSKELAHKALRVGSNLFRALKVQNRKSLVTMFKSYVRPLVEYGTPIWNPYLLKDIDLIEKVQRSFTKRLPGMKYLSYQQRLTTLGLKSLEYRRIEFDLNATFNIVHELNNWNCPDFFTRNQSSITRGHDLKLFVPRCNSKLDSVSNSFAFRMPKIWNSLPNRIVTARSSKQFKKLLASYDLTPFLMGRGVS